MPKVPLPDRVITAFGGRAKLARALGLRYTTVDGWQRSGNIPDWRLAPIRDAARDHNIILPEDFPGQPSAGHAA